MKCHDYELIVFDLDGTLLDSIPDIANVFNKILQLHGYETHPVPDYRNFVGWGLRRTLELVLPGEVPPAESKQMLKDIVDEYSRHPAEMSVVYPGVMDTLELISSQNIQMIIYSNKAQSIARSVVDSFFTPGTFSAVLGYSEEFPPKPDPSAILAYLAGEQSPASNILMIGDTPIDVETAANAGIDFAGASWGFRSAQELEKAGSMNNYPDAVELTRWLMS